MHTSCPLQKEQVCELPTEPGCVGLGDPGATLTLSACQSSQEGEVGTPWVTELPGSQLSKEKDPRDPGSVGIQSCFQ